MTETFQPQEGEQVSRDLYVVTGTFGGVSGIIIRSSAEAVTADTGYQAATVPEAELTKHSLSADNPSQLLGQWRWTGAALEAVPTTITDAQRRERWAREIRETFRLGFDQLQSSFSDFAPIVDDDSLSNAALALRATRRWWLSECYVAWVATQTVTGWNFTGTPDDSKRESVITTLQTAVDNGLIHEQHARFVAGGDTLWDPWLGLTLVAGSALMTDLYKAEGSSAELDGTGATSVGNVPADVDLYQ